jgi:hypothetical protein
MPVSFSLVKDGNVSTADAICGQLKVKGSTIAARITEEEKYGVLIINC